MLIDLLFSAPLVFFMLITCLVLSLAIHEFAHAYIADKLGDPTARYLGRVTLNPLAHIDPLGLVLLIVAGFGWGKPVPFDPTYLKHPKRDSALIALAGPVSNFILAVVFAIVFNIFMQSVPASALSSQVISQVVLFLYFFVFYNLILGFFNLIPIHPLDGFKVVNGVLPHELSIQWMQIAPYGIYLLMLLVFTRTTWKILDPVVTFALNLLGMSI